MRRKGSFSCLFPSAPVAPSKLNAPSPAASRSSMSLPLPLSPTASPRECEISETSSEASALDRAVAAVLLSPSGSSTLRRSSLQPAVDSDTMQGYMVIHTKKPKRKKLFTLNRSYYVVADAEQPVLEAFASETRTERVYLFSLVGAHVDFETDDVSHAVRAKCFCLNVQSYRKRGVDYARPQGFVFYQENQAQMMYWVKCIHVAIRRANAIAKESVRHSNASSTVGADESETAESERAVDMADTDRDESERESPVATALPSPRFAFPNPTDATSLSVSTGVDAVPPRSPRRLRGQNRRRAAVDSIDTAIMTPPTASSPSMTRASQKPPHFARLNTMLATMKHASHSSTASEDDKGEAVQSPAASTKAKHGSAFSPPSGLMSGLHMPRGKSSSTRQVTGVVSPTSAAGKRLSDPFQFRKKDDTLFGGFFLPRGPRSAPKQTATKTTPSKETTRKGSTAEVAPLASYTEENGSCTPDEEPLEWRLSNHAARLAFLLVVSAGGILQLSVFLPLAAAGVFVYVNDHHSDVFATAVVAACAVYTASGVQASLGLCSIAAIVYGWSYCDFRATLWRRRRRLAERLLEEESTNFAHIQFPNWAVRPDIDRVVWLNKVLVTGWPYMKIAIRNSIMDNLNPLLESSRPAFMSSLSLVRVDLGTKVPVISGVKIVSVDSKTDHVTLDVDVRIMSDESLVAEMRMVSTLGAAAVVTLRDLLLAGTLRVTLSPLATFWPCFRAISLCFTERPLVDFSLTAAKINLSNVPFASEWLQTFLHDVLLDYFVWPKVLHIPLWDETGATSTSVHP